MSNDFPFKLGSTSLTNPNLDLIDNVSEVREEFDVVELTLEYPRNLPLKDKTVERLIELREEKGLEYTIHLPLSVRLATANPRLRRASVESIAETYRKAEALDPRVYTLHVNPIFYPGHSPLTRLFELKQYRNQLETAKRSLGELKKYVDPEKIAVENLFTDMHQLQDFLEAEGYKRCLDVGHLVRRGKDPVVSYYENSESIINMHLHGVVEGTDHQQLEPDSDNLDLVGLFEAMKDRGYEGPVILEQFKPEHLDRSLETMETAWRKVRVD